MPHPRRASRARLNDPRSPLGLNGNFCGVTEDSVVDYTDEDLALAEGIKRLKLANASGMPWWVSISTLSAHTLSVHTLLFTPSVHRWVSIGVHRPHTNYRVPQGFYGPELYPNGSLDVVKPPKHPGPPAGVPWMSGNWEGGDINEPSIHRHGGSVT